MPQPRPDRRAFLARGAASIGASMLAGCDRLSNASWFRRVLDKDDDANLYVQRLLLSQARLAPEFAEADISPWFKPNGTSDPSDKAYKALAAKGFADYRLQIDGLVKQPANFSLAELRQMPARTQITRHDCVEGWSCIGKWTGVPLAALLQQVGLKPQARYVVFHCADTMGGGLDGSPDAADDQPDHPGQGCNADGAAKGGVQADDGADAKGGRTSADAASPQAGDSKRAEDAGPNTADTGSGDDPVRYYESIDLEDASHPQTILAYAMNGRALPVAHGAPLRLRIERQLGYKHAKYVMRIELVDSLDTFGQGKGGYWEDQGYEWYAGI